MNAWRSLSASALEVAARSRRQGARSKALGAVKYDISRRVPTRSSPSCEPAGRLAKKSHAAPLIGARARAVSALALARASCLKLVRSRLVERSIPMKRAPVNAASAQRSPLIAPISAARTARVRRVAAASAPLRSNARPTAFGLSNAGSNIQKPDSPRTMPKTRSAKRGLKGADENMRSCLARRAGNWGWDGSDVNGSVLYGWSMICEQRN